MMLFKLLMAQRGPDHSARVVSMTRMGAVGLKIQALGIPVHALEMRRGRPHPRAFASLLRLLGNDRPDVVQTWMYHADLMGGMAAKMLRIPVVWGVRHDGIRREDKPLTRFTVRLCALLSRWIPEKVVFNSESALRSHRNLGYAAGRLVVVPNGFDLSRFRPDPEARKSVRQELGIGEDAPLVGLLARYHPHKDHATFMAAAGQIRRRCDRVQFVLCGDGIEWNNSELVAAIDREGVRGTVHLLGRREDPERVMAALDLCCLSSTTESFANVLGEAMACGVPCVSTDCGDSRSIIGETGRVVPVRDAGAFADAVVDLIELDPHERQALGAAARSRVKSSYDIRGVGQLFQQIQREAIRACVA